MDDVRRPDRIGSGRQPHGVGLCSKRANRQRAGDDEDLLAPVMRNRMGDRSAGPPAGEPRHGAGAGRGIEAAGEDLLLDAVIAGDRRPSLARERVEELAMALAEGPEAGVRQRGRGVHRVAIRLLVRSVTIIDPGAWVMAKGGFAAAITDCGVTPQAQNTGSSSGFTSTGSP